MARTVLVADPNSVAAVSLATLMRGTPYTFQGTVSHGKALVDAVWRLTPWAVALDLSLPDHPETPGVGWVAATAHLREIAPWLRIAVTSTPETRNLVPAALAAGASAYIEKPYARGEILKAFNHLHSDAPPMAFYVRARRVEKKLTARFSTGQEAPAQRHLALVENVSETGVCLKSEQELPMRSVVSLEIDLPERLAVRGRAQIVRSGRNADGQSEHGLAFVELDNGGRERIRQFITRSLANEQYHTAVS
ncbi:MAG: PilZ domain-containing protein [Candidatus Brocadiae bacterium]|nr:PilZ domain-containing protein [Candidatus Brocadiia bacterium]